jgi:translation initiation factor 6 (eIF-6)
MMSSTLSSITPHSSSHTTSDTVTAPSIGKATAGSPLVCVILESYSKEILESISEQFLDLAVEVRLQTISASQLVKLLAKVNRLGYQETDIDDDENV